MALIYRYYCSLQSQAFSKHPFEKKFPAYNNNAKEGINAKKKPCQIIAAVNVYYSSLLTSVKMNHISRGRQKSIFLTEMKLNGKLGRIVITHTQIGKKISSIGSFVLASIKRQILIQRVYSHARLQALILRYCSITV